MNLGTAMIQDQKESMPAFGFALVSDGVLTKTKILAIY